MKFLVVLLVLACLANAQDNTTEMEKSPMPENPPRMKLGDVKSVFNNLPLVTKRRLYSIVNLLGMSVDDVEKALDNPPEDVKQMFGPLGIGIDDMRAAVDQLPNSMKLLLQS